VNYTDAPATALLATHCCACGRPLVDAISVSLGIGPECRDGYTGGITPSQQADANRLTYAAAVAAQKGQIEVVRRIAEEVRSLGLAILAEKIADRFVNAERLAKVRITAVGDLLEVRTPFRRGASAEFVAAWRAIPGRRYSKGVNVVPASSKAALWSLLRTFFGGHYAVGPSGAFKIPA
jgi:hypothetical protein